MSGRGLRRFVEDLIGHRRPRRFDASPQDAAALRAAITLRAARPGSDIPSEEFVARLHQRLAAAEAASDQAASDQAASNQATSGSSASDWAVSDSAAAGGAGGGWRRGTRRRFVQVTSLAAGSAAIGAGVDRAVGERGPGSGDRADAPVAGPEPASGPGGALVPTAGIWRTVATTQDLPEGGVRAFDTGTVVGFVRRTDGRVRATSGICTHQGCRLALDPAQQRLNCPCHRMAFSLAGEVVNYKIRTPPRPLPSLTVREVDGVVQVYVPPTPT
ncbi:Rieske 2Fe-2S domain-containing protein [Frankia sp. ArI3]|uniref:Rieske (2Fe-2S) protein n=1 Tax=Frankia sp. ArI3 TaxID=1858 RepID=UPI001C6FCE46|nr:Rieske 2Fe-2S domain-containing protein [Frankia sp. ArI3]